MHRTNELYRALNPNHHPATALISDDDTFKANFFTSAQRNFTGQAAFQIIWVQRRI